MGFKDIMAQDINNVFINNEEFSETHKIDDVEMDVIIDQNELIERQVKVNQHMDGIYSCAILIYVKASQFGNKPKVGSQLKLDKKMYLVSDCTVEDGLYAITLEANRS